MEVLICLLLPLFSLLLLYTFDDNIDHKKYPLIYIIESVSIYLINMFICKKVIVSYDNTHLYYFFIYSIISTYGFTYFITEIGKAKLTKEKILKNENLLYYLFILLNFVFFIFLDIGIRFFATSKNAFFPVFEFFPNLHTLIFIFSFLFILLNCPKIIQRILGITIYIFSFILFVTHFLMISVKNEAFTIYDLGYASEAMTFLNSLKDAVNFQSILLLLIIIFMLTINIILLFKIKKEKNLKQIIKSCVVFGIFIIILGGITNKSIENYNEDAEWDGINFPRYYYNNYIEPIKSLEISGLYDYTFRDIYFFISKYEKKVGSENEIDLLLNEENLSKEKNKYTGIFKDKNLIMIMLESVDNIVVNDKYMPTLTKLRKNGLDFTKRYSALPSGGSTILTEFTSQTGILYNSKYKNKIYNNVYPESIPSIFTNLGYETTFVHYNYGSYYNRNSLTGKLGYKNTIFLLDDYENTKIYDDLQIAQNDEIYEKAFPKDKKFMTFITTIASHGPYYANKYCNDNGCHNDMLYYFGERANNTDQMLEVLINKLKKDKILDNTAIVIFSDHYAYMFDYPEEYLESLEEIDEKHNIKSLPFIIYNTNLKGKKIDNILVNDYDLVPTILNMFDIDYNPNNYIGRDLFASYHKNIITFNDYSWYDGKVYSDNDNAKTNVKYYNNMNKYTLNKLKLNDMIISHNYYNK